MAHPPLNTHAFEFDSPVEFVLVTTISRSRAVVAKSRGARMDLASYAQRSSSDDLLQRPSPFFARLFFPKLQTLLPLSVDSKYFRNPKSESYDDRQSQATLVWRGVFSKRLLQQVQDRFSDLQPEIVNALDSGSSTELEWALSPLIDLCNVENHRDRQRQLQLAGTAISAVILTVIYALVIGIYSLLRRGTL